MTENSPHDPNPQWDVVLFATLPHVAFEGWTRKAIAAGLADAGLSDAEGEIAFPNGAVEMIDYWQLWSDRQTFAAVEGALSDGLGVSERLGRVIRIRLEVNAPHREAVRRTLAFLALPTNAPMALRIGWRTVDALWYAAGDTITDFRYYARRAGLGAIYTATVLYWLDDDSEDFADTWSFLDRRLSVFDRQRRRMPPLDLVRPLSVLEQAISRIWRPRAD